MYTTNFQIIFFYKNNKCGKHCGKVVEQIVDKKVEIWERLNMVEKPLSQTSF